MAKLKDLAQSVGISLAVSLVMSAATIAAFAYSEPAMSAADTKPSCSPMFEVIGESGVFGCIKGAGLSGKFTFEPCVGSSFEIEVAAVRTTKFTCKDAPQ